MNPDDVMPAKEEITAAVAQAAIEADRKRRAQACAVEVQAALERHGCRLAGQFVWAAGQGRVDVRIVPI